MTKKEFYILCRSAGKDTVIRVSGEIISNCDKRLGIHKAEHPDKLRKWDYVLTDIDSGLRIRCFARKCEAIAFANGPDITVLLNSVREKEWYKEGIVRFERLKETKKNEEC